MTTNEETALREQRAAIVAAHIAAENAGDIEATLSSFHQPRYNVIPMGAISEGEQAVRELLAGLLAAFPDFHFAPGRLHHADEAVVVEGVMRGTHKGD